MNRKAFTLIELLIVIAIMAILTGVAVPYYNDYIVDSRRAVLQNNMSTINKAINQFRGDNQRGPFRVPVWDGTTTFVDPQGDIFDELASGPLQYIGGNWRRRTNQKYLNGGRPQLIEPVTGMEISDSRLVFEEVPGSYTCSCWFSDRDGDGKFNINTEPAFADTDGNGRTRDQWDVNPFNGVRWETETNVKPLDYVIMIASFSDISVSY